MKNVSLSINCFHPRRIKNKYTGDDIVVACGKCTACKNNRALKLKSLCQYEALSYKYCYFVTLTYKQVCMSRLKHYLHDGVYDFYDEDGQLVYSQQMTGLDFFKLQRKVEHKYLPYLKKTDLQKFLKRFRHHANEIKKTKISYFAIGEYGPKHFRPHFHLLLYFNESQIAERIEEILSKSWKNGIIDYSLSRGQCATYVAQYFNSSCNVPKLYNVKGIQPFISHSFFFGEQIFQQTFSTLLETDPSEFVNYRFKIDNKFKDVQLPTKIVAYYLPRCKGFNVRDNVLCLNSYLAYQRFRGFFSCIKPSELSRCVTDLLIDYAYKYKTSSTLISCYSVALKDLLKDINDWDKICNQLNLSDLSPEQFEELYDKLYSNIYHIMVYGYRFDCICKYYPDTYGKYPLSLVQKIKDVYSKLNLLNLNRELEKQSEYFNTHPIDDLKNFYYNTFEYEEFYEQESYNRFVIEQQERMIRNTKHKEQNDSNKIFCY